MTIENKLAFDVAEYHRRFEIVQESMAGANIDLMLVTTLANVCYLTGLESIAPHKFWLTVLSRESGPILLCEDFESHNALIGSWVQTIFRYGAAFAVDPVRATADLVKQLGYSQARLGVELNSLSSLSAQNYVKLKSELLDATFVDATSCVPSVMAIKSLPEIKYLRRAAAITGTAMGAAVEAVKKGVTDNDVAAAASCALFASGSEYTSYPIVVTAAMRSSIPHSTFRRTVINPGDPVFMELGATVHRYSAPLMRTAILGSPTTRARQMFEACAASVETVLANLRSGIEARHVAAKAQRCVDALSGTVVWHGFYGYSVGLGFPPTWADSRGLVISLNSDAVLRAGMVFHVSTSLRDVGVCGITCSETVLITENGCEVLTRFPRNLLLR